LSDVNKREYIALQLDHCYFDRGRFDRLDDELPTDIVSYRKYDNGQLRALFSTKEKTKSGDFEERNHLLWIHLIEIDGEQYVKYRCDCKYFDYRLLRPAKRKFGLKELNGDLCAIVDSKSFAENKKLFNIDKHAFLALKELFNIHVQISI
jgi:hypothetical protein